MVWPVELSMFYPYKSVTAAQVAQAGLCLIIVSAISIRWRQRLPYLLVGWFWFLGTLIPVIGLVQVGLQSMADRYTYVPLTGLFIIIAWGTVDYAKSRNFGKILLWAASGIVLSALAVCTWYQVGYWQNSTKLFEHAIDVNPDDYKAHSALAKTLRRSGDIDEAIKHFREAAGRLPIYSEPSENLVRMLMDKGISLGEQGRYDEAIEHFREVISLRPDKIWGYSGLMAVCQARNKVDDVSMVDDVIKYCQKALQINPNDKQARQLLKQALEEKRKTNKEN